MEYILGILAVILAFIVWGYFFKKKYFKEIDRLEAWKADIMNRPVLEELSKVKQLNMTGETEELFENWRRDWDEVTTAYLPEVEELLFDAEDYVDKYRFKKSKETQRKIAAKLTEVEEAIKKILYELNDLVGSEEKNRVEIEEIKEAYRKQKKALLAHRHMYGKAAGKLEGVLDQVLETVQQYEEETENGNYLNARELVLSIKAQLASLSYQMEALPRLMVESQTSIPSQIAELKEGYQEMLEQGYILDHIQFDLEMERVEKELELYKEQLANGEAEAVEQGIADLNDNINVLYDLLEKEVLAKQYILKNEEKLREEIGNAEYEQEKLRSETAIVQHTYHVNEKEVDSQRKLEKQIAQIAKRYELLILKIEENSTASTLIHEEMKKLDEQLHELDEEQKTFSAKIQALRKDEIDARESLADLRKKMIETSRLLTKSNLPGIPEEYKAIVYEAKESMDDVNQKLEEKPLDMAAVYVYLEKAVENVSRVHDKTKQLIENMYLAEKVIQYGNRYRSSHPAVGERLREAEEEFRNFAYEQALEIAAAAIEKVEPGVLQRMEANLDKVFS